MKDSKVRPKKSTRKSKTEDLKLSDGRLLSNILAKLLKLPKPNGNSEDTNERANLGEKRPTKSLLRSEHAKKSFKSKLNKPPSPQLLNQSNNKEKIKNGNPKSERNKKIKFEPLKYSVKSQRSKKSYNADKVYRTKRGENFSENPDLSIFLEDGETLESVMKYLYMVEETKDDIVVSSNEMVYIKSENENPVTGPISTVNSDESNVSSVEIDVEEVNKTGVGELKKVESAQINDNIKAHEESWKWLFLDESHSDIKTDEFTTDHTSQENIKTLNSFIDFEALMNQLYYSETRISKGPGNDDCNCECHQLGEISRYRHIGDLITSTSFSVPEDRRCFTSFLGHRNDFRCIFCKMKAKF